jgi:recombination protein RecA
MRFNTGVYQLDYALNGGIPSGICEFFGEDASGKSTVCLSVMREASLRGLPTALIFTEGLPDKEYIMVAGPTDCAVCVPDDAESGMEAAISFIRHGAKVVAIDTATGLNPKRERDLLVGGRIPYEQKRIVYEGTSILRDEAAKRNALVVFVNQIRTNIGVVSPGPRSSLHSVLNQFCKVRIRARRHKTRNEFGKLAYIKTEFKVVKSTTSPPSAIAYGFIFDGKGIDRNFELLRALEASGVLLKAGAYWKLPDGNNIGPGFLKATNYIETNFDELRRLYDGSQSNS